MGGGDGGEVSARYETLTISAIESSLMLFLTKIFESSLMLFLIKISSKNSLVISVVLEAFIIIAVDAVCGLEKAVYMRAGVDPGWVLGA